jgi:3-mercaptopyruvate sulfurtransferase SseA
VALELQKVGITRVRQLDGGFHAWQKLGLPVEPVGVRDSADVNPLSPTT